MKFEELDPNENFDARRFKSLPLGIWEFGILRMLFGKNRVRVAPTASAGWVPIDYWGGDLDQSNFILGMVLAFCSKLPESISESELVDLFPEQIEKDIGPVFLQSLRNAAVLASVKYMVDGNQ